MKEPTTNDIAGVLFDKDGTLFDFGDTWDAWAVSLLLKLSNGDRGRATELGNLIGYDLDAEQFLPDSFVIAGTPNEIVAALSPEFPELSDVQLLDILNDEAANAPMTEAVPLKPFLAGLRSAGLRLGVATNDAELPAYAHLDAAGVRSHFDFIAGSDSGFGAKPEPGQLLAFCEHVEIEPHRIAMVGDSTHDLLAGRSAGMWTVAVLTGAATVEDLAPYSDVVLPDIGHLPGWLGHC